MTSRAHDEGSDADDFSVDAEEGEDMPQFLFTEDEVQGPALADDSCGGAGAGAGVDEDDDTGPPAAGTAIKGGLTFVHLPRDSDKGAVKRDADGNTESRLQSSAGRKTRPVTMNGKKACARRRQVFTRSSCGTPR
jgi:hypothetical protein